MRFQVYRENGSLLHSFDEFYEAADYAYGIIIDLDLTEEDNLYILDISTDISVSMSQTNYLKEII